MTASPRSPRSLRIASVPSAPGPWVRTGEPLLWLGGCGREVQTDTGYLYDCARRSDRPHWCLQLTLAGAGFHRRNRTRTLLTPGRAFLERIPGPFHYGYPREAGEPYELAYVSMVGPESQRWCERIVRAFGPVLDLGEQNPVAPLMLAIIREPHPRDPGDRYLMSSRLYHLLMTVQSVLSRSRLEALPRVAGAVELATRRAGEARFNVEAMARSMGCSREHLARRFRAAAGVSPSNFLLQQRLRLAAQALRNGEDKLESIARRCGFASANYLCRQFRQHVGVTPTQFRRQLWLAMP